MASKTRGNGFIGRWAWALLFLSWGTSACFKPDLGQGGFLCSTDECPEGFECVAEGSLKVCRPPGWRTDGMRDLTPDGHRDAPADAPGIDAPPDGPPMPLPDTRVDAPLPDTRGADARVPDRGTVDVRRLDLRPDVACVSGTKRCADSTPQYCVNGVWKSAVACALGCQDGSCCLKQEASNAGMVCSGCGAQTKAFFHCDGTRYLSTNWQDQSNNPVCVTAALCGGGNGPYWVRAMNGNTTCDQLCGTLGATCANKCTSFGVCTDSQGKVIPNVGYNQSETYGCDSVAPANQCSSTIKHPSNAYNAACCCQGLAPNPSGTGSCVKTQGAAAGSICAGCGWQVKTIFNCDGTRYTSSSYADYSNNAACVAPAICGTAPYWVRDGDSTNGKTCEAFCSSVNAVCANVCTSFGQCVDTSGQFIPNVGYNQSETYGCDSVAPDNRCSSTVKHPSNAFNAVCCCLGF